MPLIIRIVSFLLLSPTVMLAQDFSFDYKTVKDGLSAEVITCIFRDSRNLVWIGTQSGLQQYDGYRLKTFYPDVNNPDQLRSGGIKDIVEDFDGNLWIGTNNGGISRYFRQEDRFETYFPDSSAQGYFASKGVNSLGLDVNGSIWISSPDGFYRLTLTPKPVFMRCDPFGKKDNKSKSSVSAFGFDANQNLLLSIPGKGMARLPRKELLSKNPDPHWEIATDFLDSIPLGRVKAITVDSNKALWLGGGNGALLVIGGSDILFSGLDKSEIEAKSQFFDKSYFKPDIRLGSQINQIIQTKDGLLYMVNPYGLYQYHPKNQHFFFRSLTQLGIPIKGFNLIMNAYLDPAGLWWLATFEGIAVPKNGQATFQALKPNTSEKHSMVRAVWEDQHGQVWAGLENGGLQLFDGKSQTPYLQVHLDNGIPELGSDFITCIWEDGPDQFWVGTFGGGLFSIQARRSSDGKVIGINETAYLPQKNNKKLGTYFVYDILRDKQGDLWVGGFDWLHHLEEKTNQVRRYKLPVSNIIYQTQDQKIWIGTDTGLFYYDQREDTVKAYSYEEQKFHLSDQRIEAIVEDSDGILWIGGTQGLFALDRERKKLKRYGTEDGLSHLQIRGLTIDNNQQLWILTLTGLCKRVGSKFICYDLQSGLQNEMYIARSLFSSESGRLYAGGDNGVDTFYPDSLQSPQIEALYLDEIQLFNKPLVVGVPAETGFILPVALNELDQLSLSHKEAMVSISFSALGYKNQDQYRYAYQLEGFDPDWQEVPASRRIAIYTNLPAGEYTFKVKAATVNGEWTSARQLPVIVLPPWWASLWAYGFYALFIIALVYTLFVIRIRAIRYEMKIQQRIRQAKEEEREQVRAESAQDFHDQAGVQLSKLALYSGVLRNWDTSTYPIDILDKIDVNIKALSSSMKDFIWTLDQRHDHFQDLFFRIKNVGYSLFEHSDIKFEFNQKVESAENIPVSSSVKRHLLLFCKEALNNSLKYSQGQNVSFFVEWLIVGEKLRFRLEDNGIGFQDETLPRVNGLHIMEKRAQAMKSDLSIFSVPGLGTQIQLDLPINPDGV